MTTGKGDLAWALSWYRRTWPYKKLLFWGFEPGQVHGILGPRQKTSPEKEALPHDHKNRRPARHRRLCELPFAPNGGLIHLGNVPLFVAAILFGKRTGMIAGGIGMALFDLLSGWTLWAPFTLVIVGCMGFVEGAVTEKKKSFPFYLLALLLACAIKIGGYYLAEAVIYQNWVVPLTSIPGNLIQVGAAAIITLVVIEPLRLAACHTILRK